ncbi:MAG: radical SAM protein [Candidatus Thermoplasmatota archaeon]|jgi:DNA repair photolyase|nr:radical SAM protein [Candidatus Thermoplasmatota archaeon]
MITMIYKQIVVNSLLKKIMKTDKLFNGNYSVDPYQNCEFGCLYCDSSIDETIYVKTNTLDLFKKELKKIPNGVIVIGSVNDPYQNAEKKFKITRSLLEIIKQNNFPCHILTKSELIFRDIDILSEIKDCCVTISIISKKNNILKFFEGNVPSTIKRLQIIKKLSDKGIKTGLAIIPIIPFLVEDEFESIIKSAKKYNAHYILYKPLELKGDQKKVFLDLIKNYKNELIDKYKQLYKDSYRPDKKYVNRLNNNLNKLCKMYNIKNNVIDN